MVSTSALYARECDSDFRVKGCPALPQGRISIMIILTIPLALVLALTYLGNSLLSLRSTCVLPSEVDSLGPYAWCHNLQKNLEGMAFL